MSMTPNAMAIKKLRLAKGWSQEELAAHAHLGERTVQRAELGHSSRPSTLAALASALDADVCVIAQELGVPSAPPDGSSNVPPKPLGDQGPLLAALCDAINAVFHWRRHFSNTFEYRGLFMREQSPPVYVALEATAAIAATISLSLHKDVSEAVNALKNMHREIVEVGAVLRNSARTDYRLPPTSINAINKMGSRTCDYADFHLHRAVTELAAVLGVEQSALPILSR